MLLKEFSTPIALSNHITTATTTTMFKIFLILPSIGMKVFTNHSKIPTMTSVTRMFINDINDIILSK